MYIFLKMLCDCIFNGFGGLAEWRDPSPQSHTLLNEFCGLLHIQYKQMFSFIFCEKVCFINFYFAAQSQHPGEYH